MDDMGDGERTMAGGMGDARIVSVIVQHDEDER